MFGAAEFLRYKIKNSNLFLLALPLLVAGFPEGTSAAT